MKDHDHDFNPQTGEYAHASPGGPEPPWQKGKVAPPPESPPVNGRGDLMGDLTVTNNTELFEVSNRIRFVLVQCSNNVAIGAEILQQVLAQVPVNGAGKTTNRAQANLRARQVARNWHQIAELLMKAAALAAATPVKFNRLFAAELEAIGPKPKPKPKFDIV